MKRFQSLVFGAATAGAAVLGACGVEGDTTRIGGAPVAEPVGTLPPISAPPQATRPNPDRSSGTRGTAATDWTNALVQQARSQRGGASLGDSCDAIPAVPLPDPDDMFSVAVGVARDYDDGTCRLIAWGVQAEVPGGRAEQQLPTRALEDVSELRLEGQAPLLLLDDNGNYLGSNISALADPPLK